MQKVYSFMWWNMSLVSFESWELILQFVSSGLTKLDETIGYCWCPIVMRWSLWLQQRLLWLHHCDVIHWDNKAVSQWLLTFNLCVSVTWPLTCAFHIPCTHTPEIIDMHRGVCDNTEIYFCFNSWWVWNASVVLKIGKNIYGISNIYRSFIPKRSTST